MLKTHSDVSHTTNRPSVKTQEYCNRSYQDKTRQRRHRVQDKASMPLKRTYLKVLQKNNLKNFNYSLRSGGVSLPVIFELKVIPVFINPIFETINY